MDNAISDVSYAGVRVGVHAATDLVDGVSETLPPERISHAVTATAAGSVLVGAVNGLLGDELVTDGNHLAVEFASHHQRKIVGNETALLAQAPPGATGHVVVFVHGLGETEQAWWYRHEGRGSHGERLAQFGATPVVLRYNTGTIAENGAALSELTGALGEWWPCRCAESTSSVTRWVASWSARPAITRAARRAQCRHRRPAPGLSASGPAGHPPRRRHCDAECRPTGVVGGRRG